MAEVLITVGIIGIIAAMTLPNVIKNFQTSVQKTQFKRAYSTLANGLLKARADLGYEPICSYGINGYAVTRTDCVEFHTQLFKSLNVAKTCANQAVANGCIAPTIKGIDTVLQANDPNLSDEDAQAATSGLSCFREYYIRNVDSAYVLTDGTTIVPYSAWYPLYLVDINGLKKPNKWGYDIFTFWINKNKLQCINYAPELGGTTCSTMMENMN